MSTGAAEWQQPGRWRRSAPRLIAFGFLLALLGPGGALALQPADCGGPTTATLAEVRGLDQPPLPEGESVVIEAVVTASFPGREGLNGFFIESQSTLEPAGAFVYAPQLTADRAPARGERWRLRARAGRFRGRIQLEALDAAVQCGFGRIEPPVLSASDLEAPGHFVDRLVHIPGPLTVTGVYNLGRYGSLRLSAGGRAFQPNNGTPGGRLLPLILDDGSHQRDPRPVPYLDPDGVRRAGDRVEAITGIITRAFGDWRIHPVTPRPSSPPIPARIRRPLTTASGWCISMWKTTSLIGRGEGRPRKRDSGGSDNASGPPWMPWMAMCWCCTSWRIAPPWWRISWIW